MTAPAGYRRPTPPPGPIDPLGEQLFIAVVLVVAGVAGVVWGGAALAFWRAGHGGINTGLGPALEAAVRLPHHFGDPKTAWAEPARAQLPGPVLYWAATLLALSAGAAVGYGGWRFLRPPERVLDRRRRFGVDAQARLARPADLAPLIIRGPVAGRFVLGRLGRHILATENRAVAASRRRARRRQGDVGAVALIGPSRSGKTRTAIAGINAWRGPAILSSVKTDLLAATIANRAGPRRSEGLRSQRRDRPRQRLVDTARPGENHQRGPERRPSAHQRLTPRRARRQRLLAQPGGDPARRAPLARRQHRRTDHR